MATEYEEARKQGREEEPWHGVGSRRFLARVAVAAANGGALPPDTSFEFGCALVVAERKFLGDDPPSGSREDRLDALGEAFRRHVPPPPSKPPGRPTNGAEWRFVAREANLLLAIVEVVRRAIAGAGGSKSWPSPCPAAALLPIAAALEVIFPAMNFGMRRRPIARRMQWLERLVMRVHGAMRRGRDDRSFSPRALVAEIIEETTGPDFTKKWLATARTQGAHRSSALPADFP